MENARAIEVPNSTVADTVENVFIQSPETGMWKIRVDADEINDDTHLLFVNNDPSECCDGGGCTVSSPRDADFAVVVAGVTDVLGACCDEEHGTCTNTTQANCQGAMDTWSFDRTCSSVLCLGTE